MTREELERRVRSVSGELDGRPLEVIAGQCSMNRYSALVREEYTVREWCFVAGADEGAVYAQAWAAVVVRLCDEAERARRALETARAFVGEGEAR